MWFFIIGDTLGQHEIGGFKTGIGWAHQKCRECYVTQNEISINLYDENCIKRTLRQYLKQVHEIDIAPKKLKDHLSTTYGILKSSPLLELKEFDVTKQVCVICIQ